MNYQDIDDSQKEEYNQSVNHPMQAFEWGVFRQKTGVKVIRRAQVSGNKISRGYQMTLHKTPAFPSFIGYLPKGEIPSKEMVIDLKNIGRNNRVCFIQLEPNIINNPNSKFQIPGSRPSFHPLFTKFSFILDLVPSEEELLKNMHQKTRYNVRLAQKKGVKVEIDNSPDAFEKYLELTRETTSRQAFYAHDESYHKKMWETFNAQGKTFDSNSLQAHLLKATYENEVLATWILFTFKDILYYPYGASSDKYREVMASSLIMWEAIKFGKNLGLKKFDMWGAAPPDPKPSHEWYGFHRFKEGFGPVLNEFVGSYDLVINPMNYSLLKIGDKARWAYLKLRK